jgi:hypothetical protein
MGESTIIDDEGNLRTVDSWAAGEIIRLRRLIRRDNMAKIGDAVLLPFGHEHRIARVIAIAGNGGVIAEPYPGRSDLIKVERVPGEWPMIGYYTMRREVSWFWWLGIADKIVYEFIPNGVVTCPRSEHTETASK